jgi:hypothetical protein
MGAATEREKLWAQPRKGKSWKYAIGGDSGKQVGRQSGGSEEGYELVGCQIRVGGGTKCLEGGCHVCKDAWCDTMGLVDVMTQDSLGDVECRSKCT